MGVLASCIPFSNHNQSPRNTYQSAYKQAGIYASNYRTRIDTAAHILNYTSKPIVNTRIDNYLPTRNMLWYECHSSFVLILVIIKKILLF